MSGPVRVQPLLGDDGAGFSEAAANELLLEASWELEAEIYGDVALANPESSAEEQAAMWELLLPDCAPKVDGGVFRLTYVPGPAISGVVCGPGEHIVQNKVYPGGVCGLRIVRFGQAVAVEAYTEQLPPVNELQVWRWVDQRSGQDMHTLLLLWRL